ncbi:MAG: hypothetical protein ACI8V4_002680 [Ilumatobacter sp.]|jgi:hypothetical protein
MPSTAETLYRNSNDRFDEFDAWPSDDNESQHLDQSKRCTGSINAGVSTNTATNTQAARTITRPRRGTPKSGWRGRKLREILDHLGPDFDQHAWRHQHLATAAPSAQKDLWTVQHSRIDPNREIVR